MVRKRLKVYFAEAASLIDYYTKMDRLVEVAGEGNIAEVGRRIMVALHEEKFITRGIQS